MTTVVVVDDDLLVREGVAALLSTEPGLDVVARYGGPAEVLDHVAQAPVDLVVSDIRMPPTHTDEGIRLAADLRSAAPSTGVIVLSQYLEARFALELLDGGDARRGYLLKEHVGDRDRLIDAVRTVAAGGSWIDPSVVDALMRKPVAGGLDRLTPRELEVLAELAAGCSNSAIAAALFLSERSVEKHVASILMKLDIVDDGATNRRVSAALSYLAGRPRP